MKPLLNRAATPAQRRALEKLRKRIRVRAFPQRIEVAYLRELNRVIDEINKDAIKSLKDAPGYTADAFSDHIGRVIEALLGRWAGDRFRIFAERLASIFVQDSLTNSVNTFKFADENAFTVNAYATPRLKEAIKIATEQNAQLIRSLSRQHVEAISQLVYATVQSGERPETLEKKIIEYGVTKNRARLIARDQTSKVTSTMSRIKQQDAGFHFFKWLTAKDARVRSEHKAVAERKTAYGIGVYRWDDLPIIHGERLAPGGDYQCRCIAVPVADWEVEEWQNKKK